MFRHSFSQPSYVTTCSSTHYHFFPQGHLSCNTILLSQPYATMADFFTSKYFVQLVGMGICNHTWSRTWVKITPKNHQVCTPLPSPQFVCTLVAMKQKWEIWPIPSEYSHPDSHRALKSPGWEYFWWDRVLWLGKWFGLWVGQAPPGAEPSYVYTWESATSILNTT